MIKKYIFIALCTVNATALTVGKEKVDKEEIINQMERLIKLESTLRVELRAQPDYVKNPQYIFTGVPRESYTEIPTFLEKTLSPRAEESKKIITEAESRKKYQKHEIWDINSQEFDKLKKDIDDIEARTQSMCNLLNDQFRKSIKHSLLVQEKLEFKKLD